MSTETWKPIPKHPAYVISDHGNLRRVKRVAKSRDIARRLDRHGYLVADVWTEGRRRSRAVHQLILEAFVGPRPVGAHGRHLDGNKANNTLGNLSWGSVADNAEDRIKHALVRRCLTGKVLAGRARNRMARTLLDEGVSVSDVVRELGYTSTRHMADCLATMEKAAP